jgi:hypothetical protein
MWDALHFIAEESEPGELQLLGVATASIGGDAAVIFGS